MHHTHTKRELLKAIMIRARRLPPEKRAALRPAMNAIMAQRNFGRYGTTVAPPPRKRVVRVREVAPGVWSARSSDWSAILRIGPNARGDGDVHIVAAGPGQMLVKGQGWSAVLKAAPGARIDAAAVGAFGLSSITSTISKGASALKRGASAAAPALKEAWGMAKKGMKWQLKLHDIQKRLIKKYGPTIAKYGPKAAPFVAVVPVIGPAAAAALVASPAAMKLATVAFAAEDIVRRTAAKKAIKKLAIKAAAAKGEPFPGGSRVSVPSFGKKRKRRGRVKSIKRSRSGKPCAVTITVGADSDEPLADDPVVGAEFGEPFPEDLAIAEVAEAAEVGALRMVTHTPSTPQLTAYQIGLRG